MMNYNLISILEKMELYRAPTAQPNLNLMMLGCDIHSQETYLEKLAGSAYAEQMRMTDFVTKQITSETDNDQSATVKVFSNPYGAVTEVPQTTFNKADGFFLVYDAENAESVKCLSEYIEGIKEFKSTDTPIVILSLNAE